MGCSWATIYPAKYGLSLYRQQPEFISNNKVALVINCSPRDISVSMYMKCIAFQWQRPNGQLIDKINVKHMIQIIERIDKCKDKCQSTLIVSDHAQSKSLSLCVAYLMTKYQWELYQTLQFINSKKANLEVKASYLKLLVEYGENLKKQRNKRVRKHMESSQSNLKLHADKSDQLIQQELMLRNTFINSQIKNLPNFHGLDFKIDDSPPNFNTPQNTQNFTQNQQNTSQSNAFKSPLKKVKFDHQSTQIIDFDQQKAFIQHKKPPPNDGMYKFKQIKIRTIQNKLKQFIMDKFNHIGPQKHKQHKHKTKQAEQHNFVQKTRKSSCKTQQSQINFNDSSSVDIQNTNLAKFKKNNYINDHSYTNIHQNSYSNIGGYNHASEMSNKKQSNQSLNFSIPLQSSSTEKETRQKALSTYAPRRKFKQKCLTQHNTQPIQESITEKINNKYFMNEETKRNKLGSNSAFKISTKSISQNYKGVKRSYSPYPPEIQQKKITSEKCIGLSLPSEDEPFSFPDDSPAKANIFNVNVNVKIGQVKVVQKKNIPANKKSGGVEEKFKVYMGDNSKTKYANSQRKKP